MTGVELYTGSALAGLGLVAGAALPRARRTGGGAPEDRPRRLPPPRLPVSVLYPQNRQLSSRGACSRTWLRDIFETAATSRKRRSFAAQAPSQTRMRGSWENCIDIQYSVQLHASRRRGRSVAPFAPNLRGREASVRGGPLIQTVEKLSSNGIIKVRGARGST